MIYNKIQPKGFDMKTKILILFTLFFGFISAFAQVNLEIDGFLVESSNNLTVEISGDLSEINDGYFKGKITSGTRSTNISQFAGLTFTNGFSGTITRFTGEAYNKGNGEPVNFKRYYEISNTSGSGVVSDLQVAFAAGTNDERNGLSSPYHIYRYTSSWNFYGSGSASSPVTATNGYIPTDDSDWILSDFVDGDNDSIPDVVEGAANDRDGDGIVDQEDYDPSGWIYNEDNGEIITGGTISVTPATGVSIVQDGSNGYYQFIISQSGDYTLSYTPPAGFSLSSLCAAQQGTLDPEPSDPNPYVVGAGSKDGTSNKMTTWDCGDNPYYWNFHLEIGDPIIINNNIPLKPQPTNVELSSFNATVTQDYILISWATSTEIGNAGFNLYRSQEESGEYTKINENLIPARGNATSGAEYSFSDYPDQAATYFYKLEDISLTGESRFHGPVSVILTSINNKQHEIPEEFSLSQNYPNPFNPETQINYALPEPATVTLNIYDISGHLVRTLVACQKSAGLHTVTWGGRDNSGVKIVSGIYFYHLKAVGAEKIFSQTNKMILMK
ncbi:MAG: T9SS type A sorting domain-containing protein [Calditrichaeota bacterium]|nr:T9SS type A sorting domain-containing protein [Calditrichota bacterium]